MTAHHEDRSLHAPGWTASLRARLNHPFPVWTGWLGSSTRLLALAVIATLVMWWGRPDLAALRSLPFGLPLAVQLGLSCVAIAGLCRAGAVVFADAGRWTVGREIVFYCAYVLLIAAALLATLKLQGLIELSVGYVAAFLTITAASTAVPITLEVLASENFRLRTHAGELEETRQALADRAHGGDSGMAQAVVTDDTGATRLLSGDRLIHVRARQNYSEITELGGDGSLRRMLLRLPLARFLEQTSALGLLRTHRSWAVNPAMIADAVANAQGQFLTFPGCGDRVPVSRRNAARIRASLPGLDEPDL